MGELSEIAGRANTALLGDYWQQAAFEKQKNRSRKVDPHATDSGRESAPAEQQQRAHDVVVEWVADSGSWDRTSASCISARSLVAMRVFASARNPW